MHALGARVGFWLALLAAGFGAGLWSIREAVTAARNEVKLVQAHSDRLSQQLERTLASVDELVALQQQAADIAAARAQDSENMNEQLGRQLADLREVIENDPESTAWGAVDVPDAVAARLWGESAAANARGEGGAGSGAGGAADRPAGAAASGSE